jgi:hypothetical protein
VVVLKVERAYFASRLLEMRKSDVRVAGLSPEQHDGPLTSG